MAEPSRLVHSVRAQYADASNLDARIRVHAAYSTNPQGWPRWLFERLDLPPRARVLEVGCGSGELWRANRERIPPEWSIALSDFSPGMLADARARLADVDGELAFVLADAQALPFGGGLFDAVLACSMLFFVPDLHGALREIRRVLRPGGRLFASTSGADHMREARELAAAVAPDLAFARNAFRTFSLDNGEVVLRRHFGRVRRHLYDDALAIPEAQPLVDYILSARDARAALVGPKLARLEQLVRQRLDEQGVLRITKNSGLFVATASGASSEGER